MSFKPVFHNILKSDPENATDALLDRLPVACCLFDATGRLLACNESWAEQLGFSGKEDALARFFLLLPQHQPTGQLTKALLADSVRQAIKEGAASFALFCKNGVGASVCIDLKLTSDQPDLAFGCAVLTSPCQTDEDALAKEDEEEIEKIRLYYDYAPIPCMFLSDDQTLIGCNKAALKTFGISSAEALIENPNRFSPACQPCGMASDTKRIQLRQQAFEEGYVQCAWQCQTMDGVSFPTITTMVRIPLKTRSIVVSYLYDLRPINAEMERAREAYETTQLFLEASPLFIEIWDENLGLVDCNQQALAFFGLSSVEEYKQRYYEFLPKYQPCGASSKETVLGLAKQALQEGYAKLEVLHISEGGEPLPVETTCVRLRLGDHYVIAAYNQDLRPLHAAIQREREASETVQLFFDTTPMCIAIWDEEVNLVDCNRQTLDLFGLSSPEEYRLRYGEFLPAYQPCGTPSEKKGRQMIAQAFKEGYARFEFINLSSQGELLPLDITLVRIKQKGKFLVVLHGHDLRPIYAAMAREQEAEEVNRALIEVLPMFTEFWDTDLTLVDCSRQTWEIFGLSSKEEYLESYHDFEPAFQPCGASSIEKTRDIVKKLLSGEEHCIHTEWMHVDRDGNPLPVDAFFYPIYVHSKPLVVSFSHDLRALKDAVAAVQEAEARAKLLIEALPSACFLLDMKFDAIWCNHAALELFAKEPGQAFIQLPPFIAGREDCEGICARCAHYGRDTCIFRSHLIENFLSIFPNHTENAEEIRGFIASACTQALVNGIYKLKLEHATMYGELVPCEVTIVPIKYQHENAFACYLHDMRETQLALSEMRRREIAEEESREKTRFLARMSHEIRTPMNAVLGITDIQLQKDGHPPDTQEALLRIHSSSHLLLSIINDILDLSKVEAGRMEIIPAAYETASLIVDTIQLNLMQVGSKNIGFKLHVDDQIPTHLIGDELRIKQICNNLLSNAFKYTNEGQVTLSFGVEKDDLAADGAVLLICVQDTGQGMTKEQAERLFDIEFTRFNVYNNRSIEGTGLGMYITYRLIGMMGGEVVVDSVPGGGSTFTVRIPQKVADHQVLGRESATNLQSLELVAKSARKKTAGFHFEAMPYGRVLVVDDVETNLYVAKGLLRPYKIAVETAESGLEAIAKIKSGEVYDIVFMDHMMPDLDGVEVTKILREMGYDHPIVALTANTVKGVSELFESSGFSGFISKPIDVKQLNAYLVRYIRDKQLPEVIAAAVAQAESETLANRGEISGALARSFARDARKAIGILKEILRLPTLKGDDLRRYTIQLHSMKSALINIGRAELSLEAGRLEQAGRDANTEIITAKTPRFLESLREVMELLTPQEQEDAGDEDPLLLQTHLRAICIACENYDIDSANASLDVLQQKRCSKETANLLSEIATLLLHGDFEEARILAKQALDHVLPGAGVGG